MFRTCSTVPPNPWTQVSTCLPQGMFGEVVPWKSLLLSALPPRILSRTSTSGPGFRLDGIEANIVVSFFTSPNLNFYFIIYIYIHICLCYFIIVSNPPLFFNFSSPLFFLAYPRSFENSMTMWPEQWWWYTPMYFDSISFVIWVHCTSWVCEVFLPATLTLSAQVFSSCARHIPMDVCPSARL